MSILEYINNEQKWQEFLLYKKDKAHLTKLDEKELVEFINNKEYLVDDSLNLSFNYPTKKLINKIGTNKKRTVYFFSKKESMILKLIAFNLYKYDSKICDNCFSFRKNFGVRKAITSILKVKDISNMFCYKLDIKNYFNSIDIDILLPILKNVICDDIHLYNFFEKILTADTCYFENELIFEKRGVMAGTAVSPFLANIYLMDLDKYFLDNSITYARYSDDIIVFGKTKEELDKYILYIKNFFERYNLKINQDKEKIVLPNEKWEFLGIEYCNKEIDLSTATKDKIKGKIRRKARSIYRWKLRTKVDNEKAMKVFTKRFNIKFFESVNANDLTWSRWFFPIITTDNGLKEIDSYMQQYLRYIATGRFSKMNYKIDYEFLKKCNYRSLVNEYYKFIEKRYED